jgi:histidinol dehydrogenase
MPAGPSELLIVADDSSVAAFVADLLSQAEHGADSQVILVSTSQQLIDEVENEIEIQLDALPRKDLAKAANSKLIL